MEVGLDGHGVWVGSRGEMFQSTELIIEGHRAMTPPGESN